MKKVHHLLFLVLGLASSAIAVGGCSSENVNSVTTNGTSGSSTGEGGAGGDAGKGGTGGMASGGAGGAGGGMAGSGGAAGAGGSAGSGGGGPTCVKPAEACGGCLYEQCQVAYCECNDEPECFGLIGCIQQCPPNMPDCVTGCYAANSAGFAEFSIASSCASTLCAPSCPGSDQVKPCDLCLAQKCEIQLEACLSGAECFPLIDCRNGCMGNMMCEQKCDMMFPAGQQLVQALFVCASMGCAGSCN